MSLLRRRAMMEKGVPIGKNLFTKWRNGYIASTGNGDMYNTYFACTDYVKVNQKYQYCVEVIAYNINLTRILNFYDGNKEFILSDKEQISFRIGVYPIVMPEGTKYIRITTGVSTTEYLLFYKTA